jgi:hypothetical protein
MMKDLFPQELKEAKRYQKQRTKLDKVMAKQRFGEYPDSLISLIKDRLRKEGPTNMIGVWWSIEELIGRDGLKEIQASVTTALIDGSICGVFWRHDWEDDWTFGIRGEQSKKEYLNSVKDMEE